MFASRTHSVRKIPPTHKEWIPRGYQEHAVDFLLDREAAALLLDPGLGKTSVTFEAFTTLQAEGLAKKMLVVAPLRVCQLVWRQEAAKWTQFKHLRFSLIHGTNDDKMKAVKRKADIYLINPEGIRWLTDHLWGQKFPFDTVVIDELTKFKNGQAVRHKKLLPRLTDVRRRWGLTGTFLPNGYLDAFGQMKILDDGAALGRFFSHYRNKYFEKGYDGFSYELRRGAEAGIEAALKPYILRMSADDYLDLPPLIEDIRMVVMPPKARLKYEEMKKEMVAELTGGVVEAGNAAAVYSKLKQMGNGAVYSGDGIFEPRKTLHLHDAKIEAVQELVEELAGAPLLLGYEFNHDLDRLQKTFGGIPYIGAKISGARAAKVERDWNAGKIPLLLAHPASAGHGLNLQLGNAAHVGWFSCTWDYELYDQFIKRIFRSGNAALRIVNHIFIMEDSIDLRTREVITEKGLTQSGFYDALNDEIYRDGKTAASPDEAREREDSTMVRKLERKGKAKPADETEEVEGEEEQEEEETRSSTRRVSKRGDGSKKKLRGKTKADPEEDEDEDEDEDEPVRSRSRRQFSQTVKKRLAEDDADGEDEDEDEDDADDDEPAPKRRTTRRKEPEPEEEPEDDDLIDIDALADALLDKIIVRLVTLA